MFKNTQRGVTAKKGDGTFVRIYLSLVRSHGTDDEKDLGYDISKGTKVGKPNAAMPHKNQ